jgi:hypothetical protein
MCVAMRYSRTGAAQYSKRQMEILFRFTSLPDRGFLAWKTRPLGMQVWKGKAAVFVKVDKVSLASLLASIYFKISSQFVL